MLRKKMDGFHGTKITEKLRNSGFRKNLMALIYVYTFTLRKIIARRSIALGEIEFQ